MNLLRTVLLSCACALLPAQSTRSATAASAIDPDKAALIRQMIESVDSEQLRTTLLDTTFRHHLALLRMNPIYPPGYVDELGKRVKQLVTGMDLVQLVTPIYAEHFSTDELKQILAFRTSAVGRKLQAIQPEMMTEVVRQSTEWEQKMGPELTKQIFAEHPEYEKQIQENKQRLGSPTPVDSAARGPYRIGGGVSAPALIEKTEPTYTPEAAKGKVAGRVLLEIIVDVNGVPRDIRVVRSLGMGLDEKAVEAVSKWRFRPGVKDGMPVATRANVEVNFRLLDKEAQ